MNILLAILVTVWVAYFIVKRYKPQTILFIGGMFLMLVSVIAGYGEIFPAGKGSTGSLLFDLFEFIRTVLSSRAAKLGLNIMAVAGFARYMDHIGASRALVNLTIQPLLRLKSPYLVLSACWALGMVLGLAINSASGLAMLLMVTMFPILVALGVSRLSAAAAIATTLCLDWSPSDTGTILAAELSGIDPVMYWHDYQVPVALCVFPVVAILHYFTQKYMDKRDGHVVQPMRKEDVEVSTDNGTLDNAHPPLIYALLPIVPLALILVFSPLLIPDIKMDIIKAMLIGTAVGMLAQYIRTRNGKQVAEELQIFFDGMGRQMANVVTLIVAGETFARGLMVSGTIDALISGTQNSGFGAIALSLVMIIIIGVCSVVMGSGNAPFFAFANLVPDIAAKSGIAAVTMILPMHFIASSARAISPITAVIIVVSGMANISSFDLVKRTAIPMIGSCITLVLANFLLF
ncbi:DcuC family C4-dicarboxylate transporter [Negativicoccus succinicivorans]|uniref:DcuC family C4-dicarboxylate transporter n=1 Tax=Negativicoccus succinicivorans TaxID=620903 RepID=A0A841R252_9FIRM|nr:C4-dicarboxylate transporter DcuC [Negativicoccus succinicivorans]MBB6477876.1 DcuC family C4-dicarboxylate transporter [Negativicoccus succinicivorans]